MKKISNQKYMDRSFIKNLFRIRNRKIKFWKFKDLRRYKALTIEIIIEICLLI